MNKTPFAFSKKLLLQDGRKLTFHFDRVHGATKKKFLVSVFENGNRIRFFHMHKNDENWTVINAPKVADEFLQLEQELAAAIILHENGNTS